MNTDKTFVNVQQTNSSQSDKIKTKFNFRMAPEPNPLPGAKHQIFVMNLQATRFSNQKFQSTKQRPTSVTGSRMYLQARDNIKSLMFLSIVALLLYCGCLREDQLSVQCQRRLSFRSSKPSGNGPPGPVPNWHQLATLNAPLNAPLSSNAQILLNQRTLFEYLARNQRMFIENQRVMNSNYNRLPADRRTSPPAVPSAPPNPTTLPPVPPLTVTTGSTSQDDSRILVCYYTTRQNVPHWSPKDSREFILPLESVSSLLGSDSPISQTSFVPSAHYETFSTSQMANPTPTPMLMTQEPLERQSMIFQPSTPASSRQIANRQSGSPSKLMSKDGSSQVIGPKSRQMHNLHTSSTTSNSISAATQTVFFSSDNSNSGGSYLHSKTVTSQPKQTTPIYSFIGPGDFDAFTSDSTGTLNINGNNNNNAFISHQQQPQMAAENQLRPIFFAQSTMSPGSSSSTTMSRASAQSRQSVTNPVSFVDNAAAESAALNDQTMASRQSSTMNGVKSGDQTMTSAPALTSSTSPAVATATTTTIANSLNNQPPMFSSPAPPAQSKSNIFAPSSAAVVGGRAAAQQIQFSPPAAPHSHTRSVAAGDQSILTRNKPSQPDNGPLLGSTAFLSPATGTRASSSASATMARGQLASSSANAIRSIAANNQQASSSSSSIVSSPLSTMFDVFGAASQYLMRFKPSSLISPSALAFNTIPSSKLLQSSQQSNRPTEIASSNHSLASLPSLLYSASSFMSGESGNFKATGEVSPLNANSGSISRMAISNNMRREEICGRTIQTPERRIIGGEGARYGEFPYQVHIKIAKHQCGGALIDRQSIVTAAHCVYHFITRAPVSKLQIVIGAYDIEDEQYQELPPQYFKVNKVKLHPNFRFSASHPDRYDIAILKLDKPVKYTDNVLPVCLPPSSSKQTTRESSNSVKFENLIGTVTGFGKTDPSLSNRYGTRLLQKVDVPIIDNAECERWHRTRGIDLKIFPEMMCAGYEDGLKDACVGDSGGPLVVKSPVGESGSFRWTLAGITSAGFGCAQSRQPGIYHRVSHTVDWILENLD